MLFPVHKGLGITPNIEQSVVKVLVSQYHYLAAHPPAKWPVSSKRIAHYSRRGNRSPRLCYKTERARFQALGSSVVWLLSRVPCNQGLIDRRLELGKQFALHLYIGRIAVFITYALLLVSLSSKLPSSRQPICGITHSISFSRNLSLSLLAAWLPAQ